MNPSAYVCPDDNRATGDAEWQTQRLMVLIAEAADPANTGLWWLSFCDPDVHVPPAEQKPGGPSFLGACWVEARGFVHAVAKSHELGINPGGECAGYGPMPVAWASEDWRGKWSNRLLNAQEAFDLPEMDRLPAERRSS